MSDLRARPLDVCMSDSMPFGQHWTCKTTWPLADVLNEEYFLNHRNLFHAGDMVRISRFDRNDTNDRSAQLLETCQVVVISSGPSATAVPIAVVGPVIILGEASSPASYEVRRGQAGKFKLCKGDEVVAEFGSKREADDALSRKIAA